jgi:hypothetical protein
MARHVFVFGAGASYAAAGIPLGRDLIWQYHGDCGLVHELRSGRPDLTKDNEKSRLFREFLVLCEGRFCELKGIVRQWDNRGIDIFYLYPLHKRYYADELLKQLLKEAKSEDIRLVMQLISEHILGASCNGLNNGLYESFVSQILPRHPEAYIISLNFDFLLHEERAKVYFNLHEESRARVCFNYCLPFHWIDPHREYIPQRGIPLAKLHGSLDWAKCRECGSLGLLFPYLPELHYRTATCPSCHGRLEPFIVVPYMGEPKELEAVWASAKKALTEADRVTVMGYSFPSYDTAIRDLFRTAVPMGTEIQVVDNVDTNADAHVRSSKEAALRKTCGQILPDRKVIIRLDGFENYIKQPDAWL